MATTKPTEDGVAKIRFSRFKEFCIAQHDIICNQKYNKTLPYSFHLEAVGAQGEKYSYLLPDSTTKYIILSACFGHDLIEDARMSYNEVRDCAGSDTIADIIYCCTDEKGKTRGERHSDRFFVELRDNDLAVYVKLCDVLANTLFSLLTGSSMVQTYKKEYPRLKSFLWKEKYAPMFADLEKLLGV